MPGVGCSNNRGFTLLELLVALVLIGIILSVAVLSVGDGGRSDAIRQEAKRIIAQFSLAEQEAVLNSQQYGVMFSSNSYHYLRFTGDAWDRVENDPVLRGHTLPKGIELKLYQDGIQVSLAGRSGAGKSTALKPDLVFYSSAEHTPFILELAYASEPVLLQRIETKSVGPFQWQAIAEPL